MQISASFLKFNKDIAAPIIANAINTIISTGVFPEDWKSSYITPIRKKGSPMDIKNYRGIAMQSCIPKILDKHITELLYEFLGSTISNNQHGFRKGRSTTTNLLEITQFIHENAKSQVDVIYFVFSRAFDQIRHDLLAAKLSSLSMPFTFYRLIMNFVTGRKYFLKIDGIVSQIFIEPKSSVPQGSHSGPVLYIIFTNNMGLDELDDTKIFQLVKNLQDRHTSGTNQSPR